MKCKYCQKEIATQADYDATPEGEGQHLCWSKFGEPCMDVEDALDIARARIAQLESAIEETLTDNAHLADGENCTLEKLIAVLIAPPDTIA